MVSITELRDHLDSGTTTAVDLVTACLEQIRRFDQPAPERTDGLTSAGTVPLNAVIETNPEALAEARASDARRAAGGTLGPLDGIPYTAKDSYMAEGLTVAAGSPAFRDLTAQWDAFAIQKLRSSGAILIGLTNMPPMANGGMQRGLYGRAESPYNPAYLTSAFASGSSNGSGSATAAGFAAFGLGEETWSSGRAPASCNSLCAYTPSRVVISTRGNWPLVPTRDVVVPHTRSMDDLLEVLDIIVDDDATPRGDFWRTQPWIEIPAASSVRPESYLSLATDASALTGTVLGVPRMYINADPDAGTGPDHTDSPGLCGSMGKRVHTGPDVMALWALLRADLEKAGATVVEVDLPVVTNYEGDRPDAPTVATRGLVSPEFLLAETGLLSAWSWEDFLQANGDPALHSLTQVDGGQIFPPPPDTLPDRYTGQEHNVADYPAIVADLGLPANAGAADIPELQRVLPDGLSGLEETRRVDLEDWMTALGLDALIFPAMAAVAPADADVNPASADIAWSNGVWVANGNVAVRHLGIPTVTVPMGAMQHNGMPVGVTLAGRAWDDNRLLRLASAVEATAPGGTRRITPPLN